MSLRLLGGDQSFPQQQLDVAMVARAQHEGAVPQVINPAIADVYPPSGALLYEAHGTGGPGAMLDGKLCPELHDFLVSTAQGEMQETERVEKGLRRVPKRFENRLLRDLGRLGTVGVSAHSVDHDQERGVFGNSCRNPILVLFAPSEEAYIGVLHPQESIRASVRLVALYITLQAGSRSSTSADAESLTIQGSPTRMIASMTGFARREVTGTWGALICELRSVNHRFLETGFRLPDELRSAEPEFRQRLARDLRRGKVDCTISFRRAQGAETSLEVDAQALERVLTRVRDLSRSVPQPTVNVIDILRWPGVLRDDSNAGEEVLASAHSLFGTTLIELAAARSREGARLRELIEQRCDSLETLVSNVRARLPEVHTRVRAKLNERLAELQANIDRDRLAGHIVEIRRVVDGSEAAGRRLDFLMQELNREANTLSSKSQDLETTRHAVDMKVIIEQMREQVQNVE